MPCVRQSESRVDQKEPTGVLHEQAVAHKMAVLAVAEGTAERRVKGGAVEVVDLQRCPWPSATRRDPSQAAR
jgi:hypothetical protein